MNSNVAEIFAKMLLEKVRGHDDVGIEDLIADNVIMHTPRHLTPITDKFHVALILKGILLAIPDFDYYRVWTVGHDALMEFKGHVAGTKIIVHGLDIFTLNDQGKITALTVFLRPTKALEAIGAAEDAFIGEGLAARTSGDKP